MKAEARKRETSAGNHDSLLSAICHDLRAPLAAVTMGANFVLQSTGDDQAHARSRKILEAMLRSCSHMQRLISNFADLSEIENGAIDLRLAPNDANELAELALDVAKPLAATRSIRLELVPSSARATIRADRDRVLRALGHLIENAVKAAPEESSVTLGVVPRGALVELSVTDHGSGLATQVRANLFDRHWHVQQKGRAGTGFGLAIARGYALAHGGRLGFESEPGETTFTLALPSDKPVAG